MTSVIVAYLIVVAIMSVVCFFTYGWDKWRAIKGGRRVPEQTLHLLAFLGGWPGGLLAQRFYHHKNRKVRFLVVFWMVVALHIGIVGAVGYFLVTS